jgi:hypothetical protein
MIVLEEGYVDVVVRCNVVGKVDYGKVDYGHGMKIVRHGVMIVRHGVKIVRHAVKIVRHGVKIERHGMKIVCHGVKIVRRYHVFGDMVVGAGRSRNSLQIDMGCNLFCIDQDNRLGTQVHRQLLVLPVECRDGGYSNADIRPQSTWPNQELSSRRWNGNVPLVVHAPIPVGKVHTGVGLY